MARKIPEPMEAILRRQQAKMPLRVVYTDAIGEGTVMRTWTLRVTVMMLAATLVSAQQDQRPVFRLTTDAVSTELRVRDASGRFIPNLTINDFEILEDGVPQKITHMALTLGNRVMTQEAPVAPVVKEGLILPPSPPRADQSGRVFLIFVDDMHIQFKNTTQTRTILRNIRDTLIHDDLVGIVSTGYSSLAVDVTYDVNHKRVNEAIDRVSGSAMSPQEIIAASQTADGPAGVRHNTFVAFKTAYDMLEQAAKITNRRKAFIYVSEGYNLNHIHTRASRTCRRCARLACRSPTNPSPARLEAPIRSRPMT
jgi:VWFA-related protein